MALKQQLANKDIPTIKEAEKLIEDANLKIEENNDNNEPTNIATVDESESESNTMKDLTEQSTFLKFINVAKIKGALYKKYLDKVVSINPNVILCRDDKNRIELYFGPFKNDIEREELLNKLLDKGFEQAYKLEFTKEEFNSRCNY